MSKLKPKQKGMDKLSSSLKEEIEERFGDKNIEGNIDAQYGIDDLVYWFDQKLKEEYDKGYNEGCEDTTNAYKEFRP